MSDERKIKSLLKRAQSAIHTSGRDSVAQKLAKRRSIILRGAQKDSERGKDHEVQFGEGAYDYAMKVTDKFNKALDKRTEPFQKKVDDKLNSPAKTKLGKVAQKLFNSVEYTESYFGRMDSMGKKMGKMMRRLNKGK